MNKYLKDIFLHLDGIAMAPIYEMIFNTKNHSINNQSHIATHPSLYGDYAFILSSILKAQGVIKESSNSDNVNIYEWTKYGKTLFSKSSNLKFEGVREYYLTCINLTEDQDCNDFSNNFNRIYTIYLECKEVYGENSLISKHLEGAIIAPILIYYKFINPELNLVKDILKNHSNDFLKLFENTDLIKNKTLTEKGEYILSKSYAYGVTDSYMRTFINLSDLCFNLNSKGCIDKKTTSKIYDRGFSIWCDVCSDSE